MIQGRDGIAVPSQMLKGAKGQPGDGGRDGFPGQRGRDGAKGQRGDDGQKGEPGLLFMLPHTIKCFVRCAKNL